MGGYHVQITQTCQWQYRLGCPEVSNGRNTVAAVRLICTASAGTVNGAFTGTGYSFGSATYGTSGASDKTFDQCFA